MFYVRVWSLQKHEAGVREGGGALRRRADGGVRRGGLHCAPGPLRQLRRARLPNHQVLQLFRQGCQGLHRRKEGKTVPVFWL